MDNEFYTDRLNRLAQHPIGTIIEYCGIKLKAVKDDDESPCHGCFFSADNNNCFLSGCRPNNLLDNLLGNCSALRDDRTPIKFVVHERPVDSVIFYNDQEYKVVKEETDRLDPCAGCHFLNRAGVCIMTEEDREFFGRCSAARTDGKGVRFIQENTKK